MLTFICIRLYLHVLLLMGCLADGHETYQYRVRWHANAYASWSIDVGERAYTSNSLVFEYYAHTCILIEVSDRKSKQMCAAVSAGWAVASYSNKTKVSLWRSSLPILHVYPKTWTVSSMTMFCQVNILLLSWAMVETLEHVSALLLQCYGFPIQINKHCQHHRLTLLHGEACTKETRHCRWGLVQEIQPLAQQLASLLTGRSSPNHQQQQQQQRQNCMRFRQDSGWRVVYGRKPTWMLHEVLQHNKGPAKRNTPFLTAYWFMSFLSQEI